MGCNKERGMSETQGEGNITYRRNKQKRQGILTWSESFKMQFFTLLSLILLRRRRGRRETLMNRETRKVA